MADMKQEFPSAPDFGRSLKGVGINLLVPDVLKEVAFLKEVLGIACLTADKDFAVPSHEGQVWMLHADATYHSNPLLALTGDGALRGAGLEVRLYNLDPETCEARAEAGGYEVLAPCKHKPHGLYECYLVSPAGYVYVPGVASHELG